MHHELEQPLQGRLPLLAQHLCSFAVGVFSEGKMSFFLLFFFGKNESTSPKNKQPLLP